MYTLHKWVDTYLTAAAMFEDQSDAAPADSALKIYIFKNLFALLP
jgi:hypothetical protein